MVQSHYMNLNVNPPGTWYERLFAYVWHDFLLAVWIWVIASYKEFSTSPPFLRIDEMEKRTGQVAVITGGPRGLALGIIRRLVQLDYTIIMGVRNINDGERRLREFAKSNPELDFSKVRFFEMDLTSLQSMRKFAENVLKEVPRIDLLLCNAAIMRAPYELTKDGLESQFQVNYLSNYLLTKLLLDKIKKTGSAKGSPCHVIFTSSVVYQFGEFLFDELENISVYTPMKFYYPSKLYQVTAMLALENQLQQEGAQVHCYCVHPGLIPTDLWYSGAGSLVGYLGGLWHKMFRTVQNGGDTILWPAFSEEFRDRGGLYLESGASIPISKQSLDKYNQRKLIEISNRIVGVK